MMWHGMLIASDPVKWGKGMYANGSPDAAALLDRLPRDIMICDWQYNEPPADGVWRTQLHFKEKGFTVLACPWEDRQGIFSQSASVRTNGLAGMLQTTWHTMTKNRMRFFEDAAREA